MKIPEDFQVAEDDMEKPTNLKELIKAYVDFHKNKKKVEKVDKLMKGLEQGEDILQISHDFLLARGEPDNLKDLIKAYVQFHTNGKVDELLDGFEKYKIESDGSLQSIAQDFQLALSFCFLRTDMKDDPDKKTISLNI